MKKKLNIPVCDVTVDNEYEKNIPANYVQPTSYIRYKKTLSHDSDVTIHYIADQTDDEVRYEVVNGINKWPSVTLFLMNWYDYFYMIQ